MPTTIERPTAFFTSPLLTHEPGSRVFFARDPERAPLTVLERIYAPCGLREDVVCQAPDADPVYVTPYLLVRVEEAQRPTRDQLDTAWRDMTRAIREHTRACRWCRRQTTSWKSEQRCVHGLQMLDARRDLIAYRTSVQPWLDGQPIEPRLAYRGQRVTVRQPGKPDVDGTVTTVSFPDDGSFHQHQPGDDGLVFVNLPGRVVPELLPIEHVYPRP
ncbi:hypothetical protein ACFU0X_10170 [Streptomyces cellulosae]|uniref:Uncharacterized protein n=1 Tax=Streptomyces cellulosae TaxID=1968 RepID=A0ABW6JDG3_STRCE